MFCYFQVRKILLRLVTFIIILVSKLYRSKHQYKVLKYHLAPYCDLRLQENAYDFCHQTGSGYVLKIKEKFKLKGIPQIKNFHTSPNQYWIFQNYSKFDKDKLSLLWECCQIPDFVKKTYGNHYEVIENVFKYLTSEKGKITDDYMRLQLVKLDKLDGNVDSLSNRIANVRTWSYVSNKNNWVENQDYWIEKTKHLEDRLSDRLHEELTKTFIDKRASVLARGLKQDMEFKTEILENNSVMIDDQFIGKINGLKLELDLKKGALETDIKSLKKAARQSIGPELEKRVNSIIETGLIELNDDFKIHHSIQLRYGTGTSGSPGNYIYNLWFFEQTATYMENVFFPNSILWQENEIQRCRIRHHSYCTLIDSRNLLRRPMDEPSR